MTDISSVVGAASQVLGDATAPYALISSANRYIGTLVMDVTTREVHTDEDTITVHATETGTSVSDHVFSNPQTIEISCAASDSTAGYSGYVQDVYQAFLALKATREVFNVSTGKRFYSSMLFGAITVVTDETSEFALMVTARLQQLIITDTAGSGASAANQANPAATAPEVNVGTQNLQAAPSVTYQPGVQFAPPGGVQTVP